MEFHFDYLKCGNCEKKAFCDGCGEDLTEELLLEPGIRCVTLRMAERTLSVSSDLELPELAALLRSHGVIVL